MTNEEEKQRVALRAAMEEFMNIKDGTMEEFMNIKDGTMEEFMNIKDGTMVTGALIYRADPALIESMLATSPQIIILAQMVMGALIYRADPALIESMLATSPQIIILAQSDVDQAVAHIRQVIEELLA